MKKLLFYSSLFLLTLIFGCSKNDDDYNPPVNEEPLIESEVLKAAGNESALAAKIDQFRLLLGDPVNSAPGVTEGRREINWDGVPASLTNNNNFPVDFFNLTDPAGANGRKRGLVYLNTGSPLRLDSSSFAEIDPSYADEFIPFSKKKAIISATSNITELQFKLAGTNTAAFIKGFGIVFLDVDDANSTYVQFFNGTKSLGQFKASTGAFSFLGVKFDEEKITHIKIVAGNGVLAAGVKDISDGGNKDLVAFDDLFYDEPKQSN
ncbi:hypothetical protein [Pollutibacter soli]|uniref:hypothetical protein n=1 Tax=Pollutibacter soli TaxID=3034157 RepID=UPI003013C1E2